MTVSRTWVDKEQTSFQSTIGTSRLTRRDTTFQGASTSSGSAGPVRLGRGACTTLQIEHVAIIFRM